MEKQPNFEHIKIGNVFKCSYLHGLDNFYYGKIYTIKEIDKQYSCVLTKENHNTIHFCYCDPVSKITARFYGRSF